jgi:dTDP-4-amino-4,6-dideoxygalactose transaminase
LLQHKRKVINVTKAFLPPIEEYKKYLDGIWDRVHLTNHGPLVKELELKLKNLLGVKHFFFINNGTIALQLAIKALDIKGEVITTPFSYVATTSSLVWENATPIFVDINPLDFTIDTAKIEQAITARTTGILATHVYGIPCHVEEIERIAHTYNLKVVYDAAHAFGVNYNNTSILNYGDISTLSFHATKLFHTVEGGAVVTSNDELAHRISYMRNFGHNGQEEFFGIGINGKNSEFHAAMGLANLPHINSILESRKVLSDAYSSCLSGVWGAIERPIISKKTKYNFSYYPIVFKRGDQLLKVREKLNAASIYPRRYFFPSLNELPYIQKQSMPVSESVASRVLCLPLYHDLSMDVIHQICSIISKTL